MSRLSYLMGLTPRETWRLLRRRLPVLKDGPAWTADELLSSSKHGRGIRFAELLLRQEAVVRQHLGTWQPLDFEGRRVVEVGCGPLGGYGPLALFCGAASFESAEPEWDPGLFFSTVVREKYLRVFHADLCALYGPRMDFAGFCTVIEQRMRVHCGGFEAADFAGKAEIVLSQSVLEHVFPLDQTVEKLAQIQTPETRFLHLVDFGNHYPTPSPFDGLYDAPPETYIARRGKAINLLRASDVDRIFRDFNIVARVIPSRTMPSGGPDRVSRWWSERYDDDTLSTQLALVASPA